MKKIASILLLCCFTASLSGCAGDIFEHTDTPSYPALISDIISTPDVSSDSIASSETLNTNTETSSDASSVQSAPVEPRPEDIPALIPNTHGDITGSGNTLYNANEVCDYDDRLFAKFQKVNEPADLWDAPDGGLYKDTADEIYDPEAAVKFARAHWNDDLDLCAPFVSRCLKAGGLSVSSESSTALCMYLLHSGLGFGTFVPINSDLTITLPEYAAPGDVAQVLCPYEGSMDHSLIVVERDENDKMHVCAHNFPDSGKYPFRAGPGCGICSVGKVNEVFLFHFYTKEEKAQLEAAEQSEKYIVLSELGGYLIPQRYNREKAIEYAKNNPCDGIGKFGAAHLSQVFLEGGIYITYDFQSALFIQLLKSRLGMAHSLYINNDRTVTLPEYAREGDAGFIYCNGDGTFISSFLIAGADERGRMIAYSYDEINDGKSAFKIDSVCPGCGADIREFVLYHFDD